MRFRRLTLRVKTSDGLYGTTLDFPDGLVVIWADNSMGKSTCVKSIMVALGMEAMLTTQQTDLPLPPAIKSRLNSPTGEHDVLESEVFLEIENSKGNRIVVQRVLKGSRDKNLITVHSGSILTDPKVSVKSTDYFVNRAGAATRELGFHHFLADFLNWKLPQVQSYDGSETPLYLQCILPYFMVEQTRGWSTIQPPLPTHFRIREVHKRAVEFILNLDAHRNALRRQEVEFEKNSIASAWNANVARVHELAEDRTARAQGVPTKPVSDWPPMIAPVLLVPANDRWISIQEREGDRRKELENLVKDEIPRVHEIALTAQKELADAEEAVRDQQTVLSRLMESLATERQEVVRIDSRLKAIEEDIQRNKDVRTLRTFGSRSASAVDEGSCPVCHQAIHDTLLPLEVGQSVMSLDDSVDFLTEQRRTYLVVHANASNVVASREMQVRQMQGELSTLRLAVRDLRQTLVSDGRLPSLAAIQTRIRLENAIEHDVQTQVRFDVVVDGFLGLSKRWEAVQVAAKSLSRDDVTDADKKKIRAWTQLVREQLSQYGFGSFPVEQILISTDSYRPEHEGFDLETSFSLQNSISASDLIRTIWAYLNGMLELARTEDTFHPGCVIFDEPRQQSTRDISFGALLKRAATAGTANQQVIFFTSEDRQRLEGQLRGLGHTLNAIDGRVLKKL